MSQTSNSHLAFHCPGDPASVTRAVHLARLAAFYPACCGCPHRADTAVFSPKRAKQLAEVHDHSHSPALFDDEGLSGTLLDELTPDVVRRAAVAFGLWLRELQPQAADSSAWPRVLLAGDGRQATVSLVASAARGLQFAGCHVIDVGQASSGCLTFALHRTQAAGGLLIGNPGHRSHQAGLRFWRADGPVSHGAGLERIESLRAGPLDRPTREFGSLGRESFEADYLASLADYYHALRPLRVVLDTACRSLLDNLHSLARPLECRFFHESTTTETTSDRIIRHGAHFAATIDGNGETLRLTDERGESVHDERLLKLIAHEWLTLLLHNQGGPECQRVPLLANLSETPELAQRHCLPETVEASETCKQCDVPTTWNASCGKQWHTRIMDDQPSGCLGQSEAVAQTPAAAMPAILLEEDTAAETERHLAATGRRVVRAGPRRAAMHQAMTDQNASLGGGPSGRFWYARTGHVASDALVTLSLLLSAMSHSDRPLSQVLDEAASL